jgi:hypothetical protein
MFRVGCAVMLVSLMAAAPVAADSSRTESAPTARTGSGGKRVLWTVVGAAAGFGAGVFLGLAKFDDAINSDRKVWTTALLSAAAGGIAGNLLSRDVGPASPKQLTCEGRDVGPASPKRLTCEGREGGPASPKRLTREGREGGPRAAVPTTRALPGRIETVNVSWADALSPSGKANVGLDRASAPSGPTASPGSRQIFMDGLPLE